jgi:hypothetical protein
MEVGVRSGGHIYILQRGLLIITVGASAFSSAILDPPRACAAQGAKSSAHLDDAGEVGS